MAISPKIGSLIYIPLLLAYCILQLNLCLNDGCVVVASVIYVHSVTSEYVCYVFLLYTVLLGIKVKLGSGSVFEYSMIIPEKKERKIALHYV